METRPQFQITAADVGLGDYDPYADQSAQTQRAINWTRGSVAFNTIDLEDALGYLEPGALKHGEGEGETAFDLTYVVTGYTLAYT